MGEISLLRRSPRGRLPFYRLQLTSLACFSRCNLLPLLSLGVLQALPLSLFPLSLFLAGTPTARLNSNSAYTTTAGDLKESNILYIHV